MLVIWKHFLANRRKGALPALIGLALFSLFGTLPFLLASPLRAAFGLSFWAITWIVALPSMIYLMDHRSKTPPVPRHMLN